MNPKKIFAWVLLFVGLAIILWAVFSSYNIFSGKNQAPQIFKTTAKESSLAEAGNSQKPISAEALQEEMQKIVESQIKELIPPEMISSILNLMSWSIFAGILVLSGGKIAGIGVNLIKE